MDDPLADATATCPRCLEPMEPTDDGWECVGCAVEKIVGERRSAPAD